MCVLKPVLRTDLKKGGSKLFSIHTTLLEVMKNNCDFNCFEIRKK